MFRRLVPFANPINRLTLAAFVWTHRHTVLRWGRSLVSEVRNPVDTDARRLATIGRVLLAITSDRSLASSPRLRRVELVGDALVVDVPDRWSGRSRLADLLSDIEGIDTIVDTRGRPLDPTIPTTAV